jgi:hypothetical protein
MLWARKETYVRRECRPSRRPSYRLLRREVLDSVMIGWWFVKARGLRTAGNAARVMFTSFIALPFRHYSPRPSSPFTHPQLLTFPSTISRPPFSCPPLLILASPLRSARRSTHWYRPRTTPNPSSVPYSSSELNQTDISSAVSFSRSADGRTHVAAFESFEFRLTRCTCDAGLGLLLGVLVSLKQG